ncbi:preprotein translocase subunit SecB [Desulfuromonas acetexigens]|uniref:Preprotein translocase subunit SecB n=2 Tax=Trichloromonas acetexigens TaxID=38815 RepID=A0A550JHZ3_9BACT|nr:preprotein translocase subunit SecB [Desulfuromonas acetexigens]
MISPELQKAIDTLEIEDIYLREVTALCMEDFEPKSADFDTLTFQARHFLKASSLVELDAGGYLLRVFVDLGARWVHDSDNDAKASPRATIEAVFIAEYRMQERMDQAGIDAFCLQNVSGHVWPYWRELLNSQCLRMRLPRVTLPTVQLTQNRQRL